MASFPPVRAVVRAIDLLSALNAQPVSTIDMLHRQTAIPKPTLVRLLQTFESKGLVRHAPQPGAYLLAAGVTALTAGYHGVPRVVEAAAPLLDALTPQVKWPLTLAVPDGDAVVVRHSTIPKSPLSFLHSSIGMRLSLASQALGRAWLAHCPRSQQATLLALLAKSTRPEDALAHDAKALRRILAETRRRGYALRDPSVRPESNTLAVPVMDGRRPVASVGLTWFASTMAPEEAARRYLERLREVADTVGRRLAEAPGAA